MSAHRSGEPTRVTDEVRFDARPARGEEPVPFLRSADAAAVARLMLYSAGVHLLPEGAWDRLRRAVPLKRGRSARRRSEAGLTAFYGSAKTAAAIRDISSDLRAAMSRRLMLTACETRRDWAPVLELKGGEKLQQAIDRGSGVLLWCDSFVCQSLIGKRILHDRGFRASQVSLADHGYGRSAIGQRLINRLQQRQELAYAARIEFRRGQESVVARRARAALLSGELVMITNNVAASTRIAELSFGVAGRLLVSPGPVRLAQSCGAALLPYATIEEVPFRRYAGFIGDNLVPADSTSRSADDVLNRTLIAYRTWIASLVSEYPAQCAPHQPAED